MKLVFCSTLVVLCVLAIFGSACNRSGYGADDKSKIRVGIVFDIGGKDDRSFNAAAWAGAKCAQTGKWPDGASCSKSPLPIVLRDIELVAKDYPNIRFAIVDGVSNLPNVASLVFKEHEGSYLVGMLAAKTSKTGTIGFLGGMDIGLIHRFKGGYEEGARAVNPNIRVIPNYVGVTDAAWNNPGKGKEIALAQIGKGADVIFTAAGNSGLGAFDAVEQAGKQEGRATHLVIGVDANQNMVKPGFVLTSMVKRVDNAVYAIIQDVVNGQFKAGFHVYGLNEDGVGYAMDENNKDLVTPEMIQQVEEAKKKIINGEIKVPDLMGK